MLLTAATFAQISKSDVDKTIDAKALNHPYLLFSEDEKPRIRQRLETDQESRDIMKRLLAEGNRLLHQPVDFLIPTQGKNTRADWTDFDRDGKYERYYDSNRENALALAFLYQMTGEDRYASKAFEFADAFCDLPTWTLRPHEFPIIYSRVMPWNVADDQVCFSFDHNNGEAGREMAYVYDWLYPALNQRQRDRIRGALIEKVIAPVRGDYEFHWWATAYRCNWCGVCNSGVGMTGLALLAENPQLTDVVAESYNRINNMLNELGLDGGWQEGGGYWSYGLRTSLQFGKALQRLTKGKFDLFQNQRLRANPATFPLYLFVPPRGSINFADSRGSRIGPSFLLNLLAAETGDARTIWYRNNVLEEGSEYLDIIWPRPPGKVPEPEKKSLHFRTIDFWVMRSDFTDPEKVMVAGKAGKNDDPHHGHLDIGQFVLYWKGQAFISETGRAIYDEKYFDEARWEYPHASSAGHNVIFVNGEKQISGKLYKQPFNHDVGGRVLEFRTSPQRDYVLMDPSKAYPRKELKSWRRHVILEKPEMTIVLDEVTCAIGAEIEARFHSECDFESNERFILLKGGNEHRDFRRNNESSSAGTRAGAEPGTMALIPIVDNAFTIREDRHAYLPVKASAELTWIPYFGVVSQAPREQNLIATIIMPVQDKQEAEQIAQSATFARDRQGNVSISFSKNSQTFSFQFDTSQAGLRLKN
ncbi:MAG: heparinase II/III domain-containing protein [bacterium]